MKFPVILCKHDTLIVVRRDFFEKTGMIDEANSKLECTVTKDGNAKLNWILDSNGDLYHLKSVGLARSNIWQILALQRKIECFNIEPAIHPTPIELINLISDLKDIYPDINNVSDLHSLLKSLPSNKIISSDTLSGYFGE